MFCCESVEQGGCAAGANAGDVVRHRIGLSFGAVVAVPDRATGSMRLALIGTANHRNRGIQLVGGQQEA